MERRTFLGLGLVALAPVALSAEDWRTTKPNAWTAHEVTPAIEAIFGKVTLVEEGVDVKTPKVASNGGAVPVKIKSKIDAKTVAVFQDVNPESTVAVYTLNDHSIIDFEMSIKMKKSGTISVVVEGKDGKLYVGKKSLEVALGGCEG